MKKLINLLSVTALFMAVLSSVVSAEWKFGDTLGEIGGVEYFQAAQGDNSKSIPNWENAAGDWGNNITMFLTHESRNGNAALLINPKVADTMSTRSYGCDKGGFAVGDQCKIVYYCKPLLKAGENYPKPYGVVMGDEWWTLDNRDAITTYYNSNGQVVTTFTNSEWYRAEIIFNISGAMLNNWYGVTPVMPGYPFLFDDMTAYKMVNGSWELDTSGFVKNGDYEQGVESTVGIDPQNLKVTVGENSVTFRWSNPETDVKVFDKNDMTTPLVTSTGNTGYVVVPNLTGDTNYELVLKGIGIAEDSAGVTASVRPYVQIDSTANVLGVQVFKDGSNSSSTQISRWWCDNDAWGRATGAYLTHDAYEGNSALLLMSTGDYGHIRNFSVNKSGYAAGDRVKIEYYAKPLTVADGAYQTFNKYRFYSSYDVMPGDNGDGDHNATATIFDLNGNQVSTLTESTWYRITQEFTMTANQGSGSEYYGFSPLVPAGAPVIIDNVKAYKLVDESWTDGGDLVMNGGFEEGLTQPDVPGNVENLTGDTLNKAVSLAWNYVTSANVAGYNIYCNGTLVGTVDRFYNEYEVEGLTNDTEYEFTVKAFNRAKAEASGTAIKATPKLYSADLLNVNIPAKLVAGTNTASLSVRNNTAAGGMQAQLIIALYDSDNTLIGIATSTNQTVAIDATEDLTASIDVATLEDDAYTAKVFLWQGLDSVLPIRSYWSVSE